MPPQHAHTRRFERTRRDHETEHAEDYAELIADLIEQRGEARVGEMAQALGVTHVAVSRTISRLRDAGLVDSEPQQPVTLTPKGAALARACRARHDLVVRFLTMLGVREEQAHLDAEGIEHHCSKATLDAFAREIERRDSSR